MSILQAPPASTESDSSAASSIAGSSDRGASPYPGIREVTDGTGAVVWVEKHVSQGACAYPITPTTTPRRWPVHRTSIRASAVRRTTRARDPTTRTPWRVAPMARDLAIDLGTANTLVDMKGRSDGA